MSVEYTYTIESVDAESNTMTIKYESTGLATHMISAHIPESSETLLDAIEMYAPQYQWRFETADRLSVSEGVTGVVPVPVMPEETWEDKRIAEYPPITEYIDGVVKGDNAQVQAYIDACLAVKAKYPKS